uniref:Syntaxin-4 n=1 Tax=Lygus hesperus TaxID=30085 RepID=A0A0A9Z702_LYGHE
MRCILLTHPQNTGYFISFLDGKRCFSLSALNEYNDQNVEKLREALKAKEHDALLDESEVRIFDTTSLQEYASQYMTALQVYRELCDARTTESEQQDESVPELIAQKEVVCNAHDALTQAQCSYNEKATIKYKTVLTAIYA